MIGHFVKCLRQIQSHNPHWHVKRKGFVKHEVCCNRCSSMRPSARNPCCSSGCPASMLFEALTMSVCPHHNLLCRKTMEEWFSDRQIPAGLPNLIQPTTVFHRQGLGDPLRPPQFAKTAEKIALRVAGRKESFQTLLKEINKDAASYKKNIWIFSRVLSLVEILFHGFDISLWTNKCLVSLAHRGGLLFHRGQASTILARNCSHQPTPQTQLS